MKIALVYDRVNKFGGAEQVLKALHHIWPQAPLYTAVYNSKTATWAKDFDIKSSFLQNWPLAKTHHELYPLLTPIAFEQFDFTPFDVVISITSAEAKAIITTPKTLHLCYCLTPTRYLWSHQKDYLTAPGLGIWSKLGQKVFKKTFRYLQKLDYAVAQRPDDYLAISSTVQRRIKKYYQRLSTIIYPPVNTKDYYYKPAKDYFLLVSRLVPYKKVDLAIKAFNQLNQPLVIVGTGRDFRRLKDLANSNIIFKGLVNQKHLAKLYAQSKALIMPQVEDYGIVSLEAQSAGKPVIALASGGALDTVIPNKTGILIKNQTVDSLIAAVKQFSLHKWDHQFIQSHAQNFDVSVFKDKLKKLVEAKWQQHQKKQKS